MNEHQAEKVAQAIADRCIDAPLGVVAEGYNVAGERIMFLVAVGPNCLRYFHKLTAEGDIVLDTVLN